MWGNTVLPFFADPFPDELLYSACARYHSWTSNSNLKDTLSELFGRDSAIPSLYLGAGLKHLCDSLGGLYTPDKLIQENTLFPLYRPFMPKYRAIELEEQMTNSNGNGVITKIGLAAGAICEKESIAYCPECVSEDRKTYGMAYVHRAHQAQGVIICPKHGYLLLHTKKYTENSRLEYSNLERMNIQENICILPECRYAELLRIIADSAVYLLSHDLSFSDKEKVTLRYKQLLFQRKLVTSTGSVLQSEYLAGLQSFYGKLLELLDSPICPDDEYTWAKVVLRNVKRSVHYLRHILLINYLTDMETFFEGMREGELFVAQYPKKAQPSDDSLLDAYKQSILKAMVNNPKLSRTELRRLIDREYAYIYRRDKQWLKDNLPCKQVPVANISHIEWEYRDVEYCRKLHIAYQICKMDIGRITSTRLIRKAGIQANMENKRDKLPQAWKYIEGVSQTVEEYQVQRCLQIIQTYIENNQPLPKWKMLRMAGLTEERFRKIKDILKQRLLEERMVNAIECEVG